MSTPVKLRLYCSICARNDFYMDRIRAVADGLGLDYTLEKITDDDVIDRMDLLMPCLYAYCPGCRVLNEQVTSEHPETLCTPALEINGTLRFRDVAAAPYLIIRKTAPAAARRRWRGRPRTGVFH